MNAHVQSERGSLIFFNLFHAYGVLMLMSNQRKWSRDAICYLSLGQRDAANALKRFLTGQFVKFFLLIGPSFSFKAFVARL